MALVLLASGCASTTQATSSRAPAVVPARHEALSTYRELGLTFQAPPGLAVSHVPVGAGIPAVGLTPDGEDPASASEQIVVADNTRGNSGDVGVIAARTAGADSVAAHSAHATGFRSTIGNASVPGAWDAATLTETYSAVLPGAAAPAAVKREWIFIQVGPRHFRELLALVVASRATTLDPAAVTSSVTLG